MIMEGTLIDLGTNNSDRSMAARTIVEDFDVLEDGLVGRRLSALAWSWQLPRSLMLMVMVMPARSRR